MDRRTFLKALASFGASIALPLDLATASHAEIDTAWTEAAKAWDLFEVSEFRTLSYANFEEPTTRYDPYCFTDTSDVDASMLESHYDLYDPIQALYREHLRKEHPAFDEEPGRGWVSAALPGSARLRDRRSRAGVGDDRHLRHRQPTEGGIGGFGARALPAHAEGDHRVARARAADLCADGELWALQAH